jgi:hypothetical protein
MKENLIQPDLINRKYTPEDIKKFNRIAEKFNLEQNPDQFIYRSRKGAVAYFPKWHVVKMKNEKEKDIEDLIREKIELLEDEA